MNNSTEQLYSVRQSVVSFKLAVGTTVGCTMLCSVRQPVVSFKLAVGRTVGCTMLCSVRLALHDCSAHTILRFPQMLPRGYRQTWSFQK